MKYNIYWGDLHSNIHHEDIDKLDQWYQHAKSMLDFWPISYYPYYVRETEDGFGLEDRHSDDVINDDWEKIRSLTKRSNLEGFPMFMGYEWQGSGLDGDLNIIFLNNDGVMDYSMRYLDLVNNYQEQRVLGIPHHLAYNLSNRGKNWDTHDDQFSPFVEVYSSHGSSENDDNPIDMKRHIHMGPRTGQTSVEVGLDKGKIIGIIASGDNHSTPAVYGFGLCGVLSTSTKKEDIWDAFVNRRVYGISKDRIALDYSIDGFSMGSIIEASNESVLLLDVVASNAIDRIEIIEDNVVTEMIPHTSTYENKPINGKIRFKFQIELGWGPDRKYFPDIDKKVWNGQLKTRGSLISIEKCWSTFGQKLFDVSDKGCKFELTTYKSTASGKWMGPSAITTEGFIFEIEDDIENSISFLIDDINYDIPIKDILRNSILYGLVEKTKALLAERFNITEYYRNDPWWHNAYKIKVNKGVVVDGYKRRIEKVIDTTNINNVRIRVWQKNGSCAWSSPIFIRRR